MIVFYLVAFLPYISLAIGNITSITLINPDNSTVNIYSNNQLNPIFLGDFQPLTCTWPNVYQYQQTATQLASNTPYSLQIKANYLSNITISTKYNNFVPTLNTTTCLFNCTISITNNCPNPFSKSDYFDQIYININGIKFTYFVDCDDNYFPTVFEWGLFIIIIIITILITLSSIYSRAWSIGGFGIKLGYVFLGVFSSVFILFGVLAVFFPLKINQIVIGFCWTIGLFSVWLCMNEIIFPLKIKFLIQPLLGPVRSMDFVSLLIAFGIVCGWWFSDKNWILNDIIAVCICISFIKLFKFVNLKMALVYAVVIITIEIIIALCIHYIIGESYNILIFNNFNNPLEIQLPTITKVIDTRCSWIPVTEVIFPGIFLSYTRRFDDSRNTHMYLIVSCVSFFVASMGWMVVTLLNFHSWPLDTFTQPLLFVVVVLFALKRNQIRTVWKGDFYDIQFVSKADVQKMQQQLQRDSKQIQMSDKQMSQGLRIDQQSQGSSSNNTNNRVTNLINCDGL